MKNVVNENYDTKNAWKIIFRKLQMQANQFGRHKTK